MKRTFCAMLFGLMLGSSYAQQPSTQERGAQEPRAQEPSTPKRETPDKAGRAGPAADPLPPPLPAPATETSLPPTSDEVVARDSTVQARIQGAFDKDPAFSRGSVKATTTGDAIELSGDVTSGRDRVNAARIALSYARGGKVVNHIVIKGHAGSSPEGPPANLGDPAANRVSGNNGPP